MLIQLHPFQKFQTTPRQFLMEVVFPPALALPTGHKLLGGLPYRVLFLGISSHGVLSEMSLEISNSLWIELWSTMHLLLIQLRLLVAGTTDCLSLKVQLSANILIAYYQILLVDKNIQGGFFDWSTLKMTKCQPLKEFSELVLPKND